MYKKCLAPKTQKQTANIQGLQRQENVSNSII